MAEAKFIFSNKVFMTISMPVAWHILWVVWVLLSLVVHALLVDLLRK